MRRRVGVFLMVAAVLPLAAVSTAWACGVLATLTLDTKVAAPGQKVTATGKNFGTKETTSPVSIRLGSRTGKVLATGPGAQMTDGVTFSVPSSTKPGWYVVMATQTNTANGTPKAGTPGRTTLRVRPAGSRSQHSAAVSPWGTSAPPPTGAGGSAVTFDPRGSQPLEPLLLALLLSLGLLAGGSALVGRRDRPRFV